MNNHYKPPKTVTEIIVETNDGGKENLLAFADGYKVVSKHEALEMIDKLKKFYSIDDIDNQLRESNSIQLLKELGFTYNQKTGKFLLPEPTPDKRKPKDNRKTEWGFTCKWCGNKWNTKKDDYYYVTQNGFFSVVGLILSGEMACSEVCARNIEKDIAKDWINEKRYKKYFEEIN